MPCSVFSGTSNPPEKRRHTPRNTKEEAGAQRNLLAPAFFYEARPLFLMRGSVLAWSLHAGEVFTLNGWCLLAASTGFCDAGARYCLVSTKRRVHPAQRNN